MERLTTLSDFYLFLKLGLWKTGTVSGWGRIDLISGDDSDSYWLKKNPELYQNPLLPKKWLRTGIYLLDLYLSAQSPGRSKTYICVLSVNPSGLEKKEQLYFLKIINSPNAAVVPATVLKGQMTSESTDYYRKKRRKGGSRRLDTSPLNSYQRKY
ncbi:hypothetical protein FACS189437_07940 [Bacteroidia bacterium]|nr:hypothetical protein FACS189437_07940 [Bacteroidia bacterium]